MLTAEALAAREGLELAAEYGCDHVVLEVDCRGLKTLLDDDIGRRSTIGGICFDIAELGRSFRSFRVEWVNREANSVAHCCAGMVSTTERSLFYFDDFPEWLMGLATHDCTPTMNE